MSTIDRLFSDFVDAWNRGEDPRVEDALARAAPGERDALRALLRDWLAIAPTPALRPDAAAGRRRRPDAAAPRSTPRAATPARGRSCCRGCASAPA